MSIFRAIGFGILLIVMRLMLPDVLAAGQSAAISFLNGAQVSANTASSIVQTASALPAMNAALPPLRYPQATNISSSF